MAIAHRLSDGVYSTRSKYRSTDINNLRVENQWFGILTLLKTRFYEAHVERSDWSNPRGLVNRES